MVGVTPDSRPDDRSAPRGGRGRGRRKGGGKGSVRGHGRITRRELEAAARAREAATVPEITYPEDLPVSARRDDIAAAIRDHQVVIVAGETGSGKTTQIPKIALELGRGRAGQIGHTQPRRIAARSVAERIAEEIGTQLGELVGYQVRFTDTSTDATLIKVMTDGILLAQIQRDPDLLAYDTLIIDEAHERSLNIDVLLGYLTTLLPRRPDLRVIITSATIDSERFARHFAPGGPVQEGGAGAQAAAADADGPERPLAPVVQVTGRMYPVELRYRPLGGVEKGEDRDLMTGIVEACDELMTEGPGDILVFLSGEREIHDAADALTAQLGDRVTQPRHPRAVEILPLYSRLSAADQHRVFQAHAARRIVLATNVAETSLTVPGIHYVVDPGTARISRYSKATKVQRLPIEPISQASANQRAGRAGRLADGIAIRLYAEDDLAARPAFTEPEILRTSLASVLLQMISVGVVSSPDALARFPFVEPPDTRAVRDGAQLLTELGAIRTAKGDGVSLTDVGRKLARLPLDPRQSRMIVEAARHGVAREVAVIAAALSIQDPRERPTERRDEADLKHRRFADPTSDLLSYLNLWEYVRERQHELSGNAFRRLCREEYLNFLRVREWQDVVQQIRDAANPLGIDMPYREARPASAAAGARGAGVTRGAGVAPADRAEPRDKSATATLRHQWDEAAIHRSVLAGLLSQIGMQDTPALKASSFTHLKGNARETAVRRASKRAANEYLGSRGVRFAINPGSALAKKPPAFVMAAELVETSRLWARDVASIKPEWAEELAGDLVRRSYSEPHWSQSQGAAVATEKVLLYGVPIVADRQVLWGRIAPDEARDLFIRHALVRGEWTTHHAFWRDNQLLLDEAAGVEARARTRGYVEDEEALVAFYDERVPAHVVSAAHFDRWWRDAEREDPHLLSLTLEDLVPDHVRADAAAYPDSWPQLDLLLPLSYAYEPGSQGDGVTVSIPLALLPRVVPDGFDWLVPGLLGELTTATIRALPKPVRRQLVPAPDVARAIVSWLGSHCPEWEDVARAGDMAESYQGAFARAARDLRGVDIPADAWAEADARLPGHLRMRFAVVEEAGRIVDEATDLIALQRRLAPRAEAAVRTAVAGPARRAAPEGRSDTGSPPASGDPKARGSEPLPVEPPAPSPFNDAPLRSWPADLPDGRLPDSVSSSTGNAVVRGYPAMVEETRGGGRVAVLRVLAEEATRDARHAAGVRRLLLTEAGLATARITTRWNAAESLTLAASPYATTDALVDDLQLAALASLTRADGPAGDPAAVRDADAYAATLEVVRSRLEDEILSVARMAAGALTAARELDRTVKATASLKLLSTLTELRELSAALVGEGFLARTPPSQLGDLERYLRAGTHRLEMATTQPDRDAQLAWQVREVVTEVDAVVVARRAGRPDPAAAAALEDIRWMVEEFRVSLFAQHLGTKGTVSAQRIRRALAAVR